jgi:phosphomevalonate kinase
VRRVTASAPGKLFLTGEYAVLAGAPALVAAVDRRAQVRVQLEPGAGPLEVESLAEGTRRAIHDPERDALGGGDAGAVLAALRSARTAAPSLAGLRARVVVDTRAFLADGQKLGLGRSAATVAAAVAALLAGVGRQDRGDILQAALAAHALFQEGRGSGADVAAAVRGGVLEFRRDRGEVTVRARALPPGLHLLVGWSGEGRATDPMLRRFADGASRPRALRDLSTAAEQAAAAVERGDGAALLDAIASAADLLVRLGDETGMPIVTPALARLVAAARRVGAAAKPSGAGGGDCGIALATSPAQADAVVAAWRAEGIVPLPVTVTAEGVGHQAHAEVAHEVPVG